MYYKKVNRKGGDGQCQSHFYFISQSHYKKNKTFQNIDTTIAKRPQKLLFYQFRTLTAIIFYFTDFTSSINGYVISPAPDSTRFGPVSAQWPNLNNNDYIPLWSPPQAPIQWDQNKYHDREVYQTGTNIPVNYNNANPGDEPLSFTHPILYGQRETPVIETLVVTNAVHWPTVPPAVYVNYNPLAVDSFRERNYVPRPQWFQSRTQSPFLGQSQVSPSQFQYQQQWQRIPMPAPKNYNRDPTIYQKPFSPFQMQNTYGKNGRMILHQPGPSHFPQVIVSGPLPPFRTIRNAPPGTTFVAVRTADGSITYSIDPLPPPPGTRQSQSVPKSKPLGNSKNKRRSYHASSSSYPVVVGSGNELPVAARIPARNLPSIAPTSFTYPQNYPSSNNNKQQFPYTNYENINPSQLIQNKQHAQRSEFQFRKPPDVPTNHIQQQQKPPSPEQKDDLQSQIRAFEETLRIQTEKRRQQETPRSLQLQPDDFVLRSQLSQPPIVNQKQQQNAPQNNFQLRPSYQNQNPKELTNTLMNANSQSNYGRYGYPTNANAAPLVRQNLQNSQNQVTNNNNNYPSSSPYNILPSQDINSNLFYPQQNLFPQGQSKIPVQTQNQGQSQRYQNQAELQQQQQQILPISQRRPLPISRLAQFDNGQFLQPQAQLLQQQGQSRRPPPSSATVTTATSQKSFTSGTGPQAYAYYGQDRSTYPGQTPQQISQKYNNNNNPQEGQYQNPYQGQYQGQYPYNYPQDPNNKGSWVNLQSSSGGSVFSGGFGSPLGPPSRNSSSTMEEQFRGFETNSDPFTFGTTTGSFRLKPAPSNQYGSTSTGPSQQWQSQQWQGGRTGPPPPYNSFTNARQFGTYAQPYEIEGGGQPYFQQGRIKSTQKESITNTQKTETTLLPVRGREMSIYSQSQIDDYYRGLSGHNETKKDYQFESDSAILQRYLQRAKQVLRERKSKEGSNNNNNTVTQDVPKPIPSPSAVPGHQHESTGSGTSSPIRSSPIPQFPSTTVDGTHTANSIRPNDAIVPEPAKSSPTSGAIKPIQLIEVDKFSPPLRDQLSADQIQQRRQQRKSKLSGGQFSPESPDELSINSSNIPSVLVTGESETSESESISEHVRRSRHIEINGPEINSINPLKENDIIVAQEEEIPP